MCNMMGSHVLLRHESCFGSGEDSNQVVSRWANTFCRTASCVLFSTFPPSSFPPAFNQTATKAHQRRAQMGATHIRIHPAQDCHWKVFHVTIHHWILLCLHSFMIDRVLRHSGWCHVFCAVFWWSGGWHKVTAHHVSIRGWRIIRQWQ